MLVLALATSLGVAQEMPTATTGGSYEAGITQPGGISIVFCRCLTGLTGIVNAPGDRVMVELNGISVRVNGRPAPVLAVADMTSYQQVNFIVPALPNFIRNTATVALYQNDRAAAVLFDVPFAGYPADFFLGPDQIAAVQRSDGSFVSAGNPARKGETLIAFATGMGAVDPPVATGLVPPAETSAPLIPYQDEGGPLLIFCRPGTSCAGTDRFAIQPAYAGLTAHRPGVYEIRFELTQAIPPGLAEFGVLRRNCYRPPCTLQSPFSETWESKRAKILIQ